MGRDRSARTERTPAPEPGGSRAKGTRISGSARRPPAEPGRTPGQAEGDGEVVEEELVRRRGPR